MITKPHEEWIGSVDFAATGNDFFVAFGARFSSRLSGGVGLRLLPEFVGGVVSLEAAVGVEIGRLFADVVENLRLTETVAASLGR